MPEENAINKNLLDVLVCPVTRSALQLCGEELVGDTGGLRYPIRDGIPVLLASEAALPSDFATLDAFKAHFCPDTGDEA